MLSTIAVKLKLTNTVCAYTNYDYEKANFYALSDIVLSGFRVST